MVQVDSACAPIGTRLAIVTNSLPLGGSTTFLCNLGGELIRRQMLPRIFSFESEHPLQSDFDRRHIPVSCLDGRLSIFEDRARTILEGLAAFQPHCLLANLGLTAFEILRYAPAGVLRLGMVHTDDPGVYGVLRRYAGFLDGVCAVSRTIEERLGTFRELRGIPIHHVPLGVPMPQQPVRKRFDDAIPLRILYMGRLDRVQKRVHLFPAILEAIQQTGMPFCWTIVGEGPDRAFLEKSMHSRSTDQSVRFTGQVAYEAIPALLDQNDVFLLTSDYEGLPLSLLEAMGRGLVPVVSDLPSGIREVVDPQSGRLVPPDDIEGYAQAIHWLHRNRTALASMSLRAQERTRSDFSVPAMADRWQKLLPSSSPFLPWPALAQVKPPLGAHRNLWFSPPMRWMRRLSKRLASRATL